MPTVSSPRAVFFDAGNTLLRMNYAAIAARLAILGVAVTEAALQRAEWRARVRLDAELFVERRVSTESRTTAARYLEFVLEGVGVTDAAALEAMTEWRRGDTSPGGLFNSPEPAAPIALAAARQAGLITAVISNSNGSVHTILEAHGLLPHLDFVIDSGAVGVEKPDPRIFRLALDRAGVAPHEAVYIGDLYSIDVLGARAAGMSAILLDPGGCWGERDCPAAPDVAAAVALVLEHMGGPEMAPQSPQRSAAPRRSRDAPR